MDRQQLRGLITNLDLPEVDGVVRQIYLEGWSCTTTIKEEIVTTLTTQLEAYDTHHISDLRLVRDLNQERTLGGYGTTLRIQNKCILLEFIIDDFLDREVGCHLRLVFDGHFLCDGFSLKYGVWKWLYLSTTTRNWAWRCWVVGTDTSQYPTTCRLVVPRSRWLGWLLRPQPQLGRDWNSPWNWFLFWVQFTL